MTQQAELDKLAYRVFDLLKQKGQILVTAESCTAGLISATLARVPGMSACFAGAFVVYQTESKIAWLEVPAELISQFNAVSSEVAEAMASNTLANTPHATLAVSITGHLGPESPKELDGVAWLGFVSRVQGSKTQKLQLTAGTAGAPFPGGAVFIRRERQKDAVEKALGFLCDRLAEMPNAGLTAP